MVMEQLVLKVNKFEEGLWSFYLLLPEDLSKKYIDQGIKRLMCSINGNEAFHTGLMPDGKGGWFIMLNKDKMKRYKLTLGDVVGVSIKPDESKYGMPMPEAFEELLYQDPEGSKYFESLTPGKKRSLIYIVDKPKSENLKISKAIIILEHLKANHGLLDYKVLYEDLKNK